MPVICADRPQRPRSTADPPLMSIQAASNLQAASTSFQIAIAVAAKAMNAERDQGAAEVKTIQDAAQTMDKAASAIAADGSLDVYA